MVLKVWAQLEASGYVQHDARNTSRGQEKESCHAVFISTTVTSLYRKYLHRGTEVRGQLERCMEPRGAGIFYRQEGGIAIFVIVL